MQPLESRAAVNLRNARVVARLFFGAHARRPSDLKSGPFALSHNESRCEKESGSRGRYCLFKGLRKHWSPPAIPSASNPIPQFVMCENGFEVAGEKIFLTR